MYYVYLWDALGPYLSAEASGVVGRRFKRNILPQTSANGDFFSFKVADSMIFGGPKLVKNAFFSMFFEIQIAVENFLCIKHPQNKYLQHHPHLGE